VAICGRTLAAAPSAEGGTTASGSHAAAWTAALRAGRTALLAGELDSLAVTIDDHHCGALYTPARDLHGCIDPDQLTATLIDLHQAATAGELADQLVATTSSAAL
jgi:hypothetical protein